MVFRAPLGDRWGWGQLGHHRAWHAPNSCPGSMLGCHAAGRPAGHALGQHRVLGPVSQEPAQGRAADLLDRGTQAAPRQAFTQEPPQGRGGRTLLPGHAFELELG
jgi:hypothetical protein